MCNFPARELLAYHQHVISEAEVGNYNTKKADAVVQAIEYLVAFHGETGCPCWDDLLVEEGWLDEIKIPRKPVGRAGSYPLGTKGVI